MPVSTRIDVQDRLVTFQCAGTVVLGDIEHAYGAMFQDPSFEPGLNALWDMREASIGVYAQQIPDILRMISARQEDRGTGYRVAILVAGSPDFGMSTLFEMSAQSMPFQVRVFRSSTRATRWLKGEDV